MQLPAYVMKITEQLTAAGYATYLVGGAVRDTLLGLTPQDWDLMTTALPAEVCKLFPKVIPTGIRHGTVTVMCEGGACEVSTLHGDDLRQDLGRRDFTINAIAYDVQQHVFIDPFDGRTDLLMRKIIRAVGDPSARFREDPLRLLRAVRLRTRHLFTFDQQTWNALAANAGNLAAVAPERVRNELSALLVGPYVEAGLNAMVDGGLMTVVIPELMEGYEMQQSSYHAFDVLTHGIKACAVIEPVLHLRLAALLHDVGKPPVRRIVSPTIVRFDGHPQVGAARARLILTRLRYPKAIINLVAHLVYHHMFTYHREADDAGVRRVISTVGVEYINDLIKVRTADFTMVNPQRHSDYLARLTAHFSRVLAGPVLYSVQDLAVDGAAVKAACGVPEGPLVGEILHALLAKVQENPALNEESVLLTLAKQLRCGNNSLP